MNNHQDNNLSQSEEAIKNGDFSDMENIISAETEPKESESLIGLVSVESEKKILDGTEQQIANLRQAQEVFQDEVDKCEEKIQILKQKRK